MKFILVSLVSLGFFLNPAYAGKPAFSLNMPRGRAPSLIIEEVAEPDPQSHTEVTIEDIQTITGTKTFTNIVINGTCTGTGCSNGTTSGQQAKGLSYNSSGTTTAVDSSITPPTTNGIYNILYNVVGGVAVVPTASLVGLATRGISGSTTSDTTLYSDDGNIVDDLSSANVSVVLPTPTSLTNANFFTVYRDWSTSKTLTITPATLTINSSSNLVMTPLEQCAIGIDPTNTTTNWLPWCTDYAGSLNGVGFSSLGSGLVYNTTGTGVPSIATASQVNTVIQGLTGCNTAAFVYTPQAADCVAQSGGVAKIPIQLPVAVCQGTGVSIGGSGVAATLPAVSCNAGSTTVPQSGAQVYAQATLGTLYVDYNIVLPAAFTSIDTVVFKVYNDTATTGTDYMNFQYKCVADGATFGPTYASVQQASGAVPGTINQFVTLTLTAPTITGCSAGNVMYIRIGAGTGSGVFASGNIDLAMAKVELH